MLVVYGLEFAYHLNMYFAYEWSVCGGEPFDRENFKYKATSDSLTEEERGDDACALFISFPGNKVNILQEYYIQLVKHCKEQVILHNPYIVDSKFLKVLRGLPQEQANKITIMQVPRFYFGNLIILTVTHSL